MGVLSLHMHPLCKALDFILQKAECYLSVRLSECRLQPSNRDAPKVSVPMSAGYATECRSSV